MFPLACNYSPHVLCSYIHVVATTYISFLRIYIMRCCVVGIIPHFQNLVKGEGNVHSGATPPWLREDNNEGDAPAQIGPSEEEFLRHSK